MKRAALFLIASSITLASLAALPTSSDSVTVAVPVSPVLTNYDYVQSVDLAAPYTTLVHVEPLPKTFIFGVSGLYLQPSHTNNDLDFVQMAAALPPTDLRIKNIDPDYNWNWGVNAGIIFPDTANDLSADYLNFDNTRTRILSFTQPLINTLPPVAGFVFAAAKAELSLQQADLTFGQLIYVGNHFTLHPKAGIGYGQIERKLNRFFLNPEGTIPVEFAFLDQTSDYDGIGPLVGVDLGYYIGAGISLVGHFNSALLVGTQKSDIATFIGTNPPDLPAAVNTRQFIGKDDWHRELVPMLDGKLGVNYTYPFINNPLLSSLSFEVGYEAINYFEATSLLTAGASSGVDQSSIPFIETNTTNDFQINGLYLNLTVRA